MRSAIAHPCIASPPARIRSTSRSRVPSSLSAFLIDVYVTYSPRSALMSRARFRLVLAVTALGIAVFASTATVQPDETGGVLLPAKLDAEGSSQMLIPVSVDGHTFWCSADSG